MIEHAKTTVVDAGTAHERVRHDHDCFGRVAVTKIHGTPRAVFGSPLAHDTTIGFQVTRAHMDHQSGRDRLGSDRDDLIVEFHMSMTQFAEMTSSVGSATGVPVTLQHAPERGTRAARMPELAVDPVKKIFDGDVRAAAKKASAEIRGVQDRFKEFLAPGAKTPTKKDIEALYNQLLHAGQYFEGNMAFLQEAFTETTEGAVAAAKVEIDAYLDEAIRRRGMEALVGQGRPVQLLLEGSAEIQEQQ